LHLPLPHPHPRRAFSTAPQDVAGNSINGEAWQSSSITVKNHGKEVIPTEKGARVRFRVSDVFLPHPEELLKTLFEDADAEAEGAIVDFSDSGTKRDAFAVVEVDSGQTWVVPVQKLRPAASELPGRGEP